MQYEIVSRFLYLYLTPVWDMRRKNTKVTKVYKSKPLKVN